MNVRKWNKTSSVGNTSQSKKRAKMNPLIGVSRYLEPISRGLQQLQAGARCIHEEVGIKADEVVYRTGGEDHPDEERHA